MTHFACDLLPHTLVFTETEFHPLRRVKSVLAPQLRPAVMRHFQAIPAEFSGERIYTKLIQARQQ